MGVREVLTQHPSQKLKPVESMAMEDMLPEAMDMAMFVMAMGMAMEALFTITAREVLTQHLNQKLKPAESMAMEDMLPEAMVMAMFAMAMGMAMVIMDKQ